MDAVPADVFRIKDFKARYFLCIRFALCEQVSMIASINPSTILLFIKTFQEHHVALARVIEEGRLGVSLSDNRHLEEFLEAKCYPRPDVAQKIRESAAKNEGGAFITGHLAYVGQVFAGRGAGSWYLRRLNGHLRYYLF